MASADISRLLFKSGLTLEIEILPLADTFFKHLESITQPHRAEFYHVIWFQTGTATHLVDFKPVRVEPNTLLFVNKHRVHVLDKQGGYDGKMLIFTDNFFGSHDTAHQFLRNTILFNDLVTEPMIHVDGNAAVLNAFRFIETELAALSDTLQPELLRNSLHNLLLLAERERRRSGFTQIKAGADLDYTLLFRNLLENQYRSIRTVNSYAKQMAVSERRLSQATGTTLGKTPKELIDERVVLEIKRLLVHTSASIKEIGYKLGFEEPTNFIKYFRKHVGQTPIEFRDAFQS